MECGRCPAQAVITAFVEANLEESMGRCQSRKIKEAIAKAQEAMQNICLTCAHESNDNNPSNHGQTYYSLDSGHCQSNSGKSKTSHSDDNEVISRADWINSNAAYDSNYYQDHQLRPYSGNSPLDPAFAAMKYAMEHETVTEVKKDDGNTLTHARFVTMPNGEKIRLTKEMRDIMGFFCPEDKDKKQNPYVDDYSLTNLPSELEAIILREMNNFAGLPMQAKMLICCLLEGKNLSDFARLTWLPKGWISKEARKKSPVSPQTAHALFFNICKRLPHFAVLARATKKRSKERVNNQAESIKKYQQLNNEHIAYLKTPETMHKKPSDNPLNRVMKEGLISASKVKGAKPAKKTSGPENVQPDLF